MKVSLYRNNTKRLLEDMEKCSKKIFHFINKKNKFQCLHLLSHCNCEN